MLLFAEMRAAWASTALHRSYLGGLGDCGQILPSFSHLINSVRGLTSTPERAPLGSTKGSVRKAGKNLGETAGPVLEALTGDSSDVTMKETPKSRTSVPK